MEIIVHNTISLDGSVKNFFVDMGLHYSIVNSFNPDAILVGSITASSFEGPVPKETVKDFIKPKRKNRPLWVFIDSSGKLKGLLHIYRRFELMRDIIVLVSNKTNKSYIKYLEDRNYDYLVFGKDKVDLKKALKYLENNLKVKTVVTDNGGVLSSVLFNLGVVNYLSLIISPFITGFEKCLPLFRKLRGGINLRLIKIKKLKNSVYLLYKIV